MIVSFFNFQIDEKPMNISALSSVGEHQKDTPAVPVTTEYGNRKDIFQGRPTVLHHVDALINVAKRRTSNTPPSNAAKEDHLDI